MSKRRRGVCGRGKSIPMLEEVRYVDPSIYKGGWMWRM
jgi:hypothetical protein